jgi:dephospho-CoA kinase
MDKWPDKRVLGLIGQPGTGKTTVFKMLEKMGVYAIDADAVAERIIASGAPGYTRLISLFGEELFDRLGELDQARFQRILKENPENREAFKSVINPLIRESVVNLIQTAFRDVIVIKADNLNEFGLLDLCDRLWGLKAPRDVQITNLVWKYKWTDEEAENYIEERAGMNVLLDEADVVIVHSGSRADLIRQVSMEVRALGLGKKE